MEKTRTFFPIILILCCALLAGCRDAEEPSESVDKQKIADGWIVTAENKIPLLLIRLQFKDQVFENSPEIWADKFFGNQQSQLNHYMNQTTLGKYGFIPVVETEGTINDGVVTVTLDQYHPSPGAYGSFQKQLVDAIRQVDRHVDFATYDTSGNTVLDATEMQVMFLVAGYEAAIGGAPSPNTWAHKYCINSAIEGITEPLLDKVFVLSCSGHGYTRFGERHKTSFGEYDATIGVIAHELSHGVFELPDLYDVDGSSAGIGFFGLMSSGSWGYGMTTGVRPGELPVHMSAWSKIKIGAVTPTEITSGSTDAVLTGNDSLSYNVYKLPTGIHGEYFLVENRPPSGYDQGLYIMQSGSGVDFSGGLAIWHIDETRSNNNTESRKLVDLEEANSPGLDGGSTFSLGKLEHLFYSGNRDSFDSGTTPNSNSYSGLSTGVSISNISGPGRIMTATISNN